MKTIDFNKTVYEIAAEHPEAVDIMKAVGFSDIAKPGMLSTAGRFVTIKKGAAMKHIPLETIAAAFSGSGFEVIGM